MKTYQEFMEGLFTELKKKFPLPTMTPEKQKERNKLLDLDDEYVKTQKHFKDLPHQMELKLKEEQLLEASYIRKSRVRNGKLQRNVRVSNSPGYVYRGGTLKRMSQAESRHRRLAAKLSARKRRAKHQQAMRKRKLSLRKRKMAGL